MTRKHYEAIARIIKDAEPATDLAMRVMVYQLAEYFKGENQNFAHEKFYEACGIEASQYRIEARL